MLIECESGKTEMDRWDIGTHTEKQLKADQKLSLSLYAIK